jgi:hypothetical protein
MAQDPIQPIGRTLEQSRGDRGLEQYLDDHLICGWRQSLVSIGIKAENGDLEAGRVADAFEDWVFTLCRRRKVETRRSVRLNVISLAEFASGCKASQRRN